MIFKSVKWLFLYFFGLRQSVFCQNFLALNTTQQAKRINRIAIWFRQSLNANFWSGLKTQQWTNAPFVWILYRLLKKNSIQQWKENDRYWEWLVRSIIVELIESSCVQSSLKNGCTKQKLNESGNVRTNLALRCRCSSKLGHFSLAN